MEGKKEDASSSSCLVKGNLRENKQGTLAMGRKKTCSVRDEREQKKKQSHRTGREREEHP